VISVVMPAHNEQAYLTDAVEQVVIGLRARSHTFEVLVCENGSTDATAQVATGLAERYPEVRTMSSPAPDYGMALRTGFLAAAGDTVVNFDVDYIDLDFLDEALALAEAPGGPAGIVASKRSPGAHDTRGAGRRLVTAVFSMVLRHGFGLGVSDTHGMKMLRRKDVAAVVETCRFGTDLFDTELILRMERAGLAVAELPVTVTDTRPPRTPIMTRIPRSLAGLARLRVALWRESAGR
jgi:glycosyltransferase AglD